MGTVDLHDTDSVYPTPNGAPFLDEYRNADSRFLLSLPAPGAVSLPVSTQLDYARRRLLLIELKQLLPFNSFHSFGVADLLPLDSISIARTSSHPLTDCLSLNDMSLQL
ncbi:hypothetical protein BSLG_005889 [Batrachochytrium salamandrivorans]|nr:hypothetical protein BSLG_005889 [Batrachochytrium salamandrivorans]